jgi:hypothetical protein
MRKANRVPTKENTVLTEVNTVLTSGVGLDSLNPDSDMDPDRAFKVNPDQDKEMGPIPDSDTE